MLKTIYDNEEDIPEGFRDLYTEKNGKWELTGVQGVKTQADIDRVQGALTKERADHKKAKDALAAFEGIDPTKVRENETALEEARAQLEAINKDGRIDETKLEPIIAARIKQAVSPLERDKTNLERQLDAQRKAVADKDAENTNLRTTMVQSEIERAVRDEAIVSKMLPTAVTDAVMHSRNVFEKTEDGRIITKDGSGAVPGLTPKEWLKDMQEKAPHWWPASVGGGANGAGPKGGTYTGANNPWTKEGWNLTKQGQLVKTLGEEKAGAIAAQAGVKIGATKPAAA